MTLIDVSFLQLQQHKALLLWCGTTVHQDLCMFYFCFIHAPFNYDSHRCWNPPSTEFSFGSYCAVEQRAQVPLPFSHGNLHVQVSLLYSLYFTFFTHNIMCTYHSFKIVTAMSVAPLKLEIVAKLTGNITFWQAHCIDGYPLANSNFYSITIL
jgi:hypothetical protein